MQCFVATLAMLLATEASAQSLGIKAQIAPTLAPPAAVVAWINASATSVERLNQPPAANEAATIDRITDGARVIAFGESNHGNREPLEYRNRLIRYMIEHRGLTAVALESGLAESRRLYDYVLGGPGNTAPLVRSGLTHGFGQLKANRALVDWLREWNRNHYSRHVRLYGVDRSTIQSAPPGARPDSVVLNDIVAYLERTDSADSRVVRDELCRLAPKFNETDYLSLGDDDRRALDAALSATQSLLVEHRSAMTRRSSADAFDWASREAYDAAQLPELFRAWSVDGSDLPRLKHLLDLRDGAMADHLLWVLRREGARGRVLLFQANGHVTAAPMIGSVMRDFAEQPLLTGIALRRALGRNYRVIVTVSSRGKAADDPASGSIDRAFAAIGRAPVLLDLRTRGRSVWWSQTQSASQGDMRLDDVVPAAALDGIVYFDQLTPLPPPTP